jgi:hypothetical protein
MRRYRDPDAGKNVGSPLWPFLLLALVVPLASLPLVRSIDWSDVAISAVLIAAGLMVHRAVERNRRDVKCIEVRLDDGGTCELETADHVTRIDVSEIRAVEYRRDSENGAESYVIRYRNGKAELGGNTTDFADFLGRLTTLNPGVDVSSFPRIVAETLPGAASSEHRSPLETFLRSGLVPLGVILLVVYLASQTLVR